MGLAWTHRIAPTQRTGGFTLKEHQLAEPAEPVAPHEPTGNGAVSRLLSVSRAEIDPPAAAAVQQAVAPGAGDVAAAAATAGVTAAASDPAIEALDLKPKAKAAATALKQAFPSISFTSGKRGDVSDQARAMAGNVVSNRNWITETYADKTLAARLQRWLDDNPDAKTKDAIAKGLAEVMSTWTEAERGRLSAHFSGEAFDVRPQTDKADDIKAKAQSLAKEKGGKFLEKEGGLVRWHFQVRE
jgi:hypothetical protein